MKRVISIILTLVMIGSLCMFSAAQTAAATSTLTVTALGKSITLNKGEDVLLNVYLNAGSAKILNGQGYISYPKSKLSVDLLGTYDKYDLTDAYSYPNIPDSLMVTNTDIAGTIYYNFSKSKGIVAFNSNNMVFVRYRFKAIGTGTATITPVIEYMINENEDPIYYDSKAVAAVNPKMTCSLEKSSYFIGDVNGDNTVTVKDATLVQRVCAGISNTYKTDLLDADRDKSVTLLDAVAIRLYVAGSAPNKEIGAPVFA